MKLVGLFSFFDEPVDFIHRMISSLPTVGVDHLVALDGKYSWFPCSYDTSPTEQHEAIEKACAKAGITLSLHRHGEWAGEIEKRTALFQHGEAVTTEHDWWLILDGDEEYTAAPDTLHFELEHGGADVADAMMWERVTPGSEQWESRPFPKFFRACRGTHCVGNHYTYRTGDGRYLWGNGRHVRLVPRIVVDVDVKHYKHERPPARRTAAVFGYAHRDTAGLEHEMGMRAAA